MPPSSPPAPSGKLAALVGKPSFWVILLLVGFALPTARALTLGTKFPAAPAIRMPLPEFSLTDEHNEPFGLSNLRGKVWVADFVFTSCPTVCPKLTKRMAEIQHRTRGVGNAFHLVTFTVDPENDTPERLLAYAQANRASPTRWSFLTGKLGDLETTVVKGFKMAMGKEEMAPGIFSIFHGERLVLVDQEGAIRGFFEATDDGVADLLRTIGVLVNQPS